jgi:hypothetical protein
MATKREGVACYDKAGIDEELFVMRAQDQLAPAVVEYWAYLAAGNEPIPFRRPVESIHAGTKVAEALRCASRMREHPNRKQPD